MIRSKIGCLLLLATSAWPQITLSNLTEYQLGNLPYDEPEYMSSLYNQLKVSYRFSDFNFAIQTEQFQSPYKDRDYNKIMRRSLEYRKDRWEFTLGNFYQLFGQGLLLRSYNIPGSTQEDLVYRSRYGFFKDIDGLSLQYYGKWLQLKALHGRPLHNELPPTFSDDRRRTDLVEGLETIFKLPGGVKVGASVLRNNLEALSNRYAGLSLDLRLLAHTRVYTEYVQQSGGKNPNFSLSDTSIHALYTSLSGSLGSLGWSFEYKDYNNFNLPFNDPPPLIKEHSYAVLNRSTHLLNANSESGWQMELFYTLPAGHSMTVNLTRAENVFGNRSYVFEEAFAELALLPSYSTSIKLFVDSSTDPAIGEVERLAGGVYWDQLWFEDWGTTLDLEYQQYHRNYLPDQTIENYYAAANINFTSDLSVGITWERSSDPFLTDDPTTTDIESKARNWLGLGLGYQLNQHHALNLFYGQRRGGPACTGGLCYEVLDFRGLEFRLRSTF